MWVILSYPAQLSTSNVQELLDLGFWVHPPEYGVQRSFKITNFCSGEPTLNKSAAETQNISAEGTIFLSAWLQNDSHKKKRKKILKVGI